MTTKRPGGRPKGSKNKPERKLPLDITGLRFGRLVALRYGGDKKWWFKCDCGVEKLIKRGPVACGGTISCGCRAKEKGVLHPKYRGCGRLSKLHWTRININATTRGHKVLVSIEDAWNQYLAQDGKCALSGLPIDFSYGRAISESTASFDRIDSSGDYSEGNVQWVHKKVNIMKNCLPEVEFFEFCRLVTEHQRRL